MSSNSVKWQAMRRDSLDKFVKQPLLKVYEQRKPTPEVVTIDLPSAINDCLKSPFGSNAIRNKQIPDLRHIVVDLIHATRPADFQFCLLDVVIEKADLTDLDLPFSLSFVRCVFLNGIHFDGSTVREPLNLSGHICGKLTFNGVTAESCISLSDLDVDQCHVTNSKVAGVDLQNTRVGDCCICDTTIDGGVGFYEVEFLDVVLLEQLAVGNSISFEASRAHANLFRISQVIVEKDITFHQCHIDSDVRTRDIGRSKCQQLSIKNCRCQGSMDFRQTDFETLDVSGSRFTCPLYLDQDQLIETSYWRGILDAKIKLESVKRMQSAETVETGKCAQLAKTIEQLGILRENFRSVTTHFREADYCMYQLIDYSFHQSAHGKVAKVVHWLWKFCFGYFVTPWRTVRTSLLLICIFAVVYANACLIGGGNLALGRDEYISNLNFLERTLQAMYFSVATFTTHGYRDIHPTGLLEAVAMLEVVLGPILTAMFVVALVRHVLRRDQIK